MTIEDIRVPAGSFLCGAVLGALPSAVDPTALSLNENPFPPLPSVRSAMVATIGAANRYPEFLPIRLRSLIAHRLGVDDGQVVLGAGITGVVLQVLHALTSPGDRIVLPTPAFDGYPILAAMARLVPVPMPLDGHGHHDLPALAEAASDARVVVLCRPHNPTGTIESVADVERFLAAVPTGTVVLLDEAYVEFVDSQHRIDGPTLVSRYPNVIVLRTFSKAYGLAGMRIGYGFGAAHLAQELWAMQPPFAIAETGAVAVAASYDADAQLSQRIRLIAGERRYLQRRLRSMGIYGTDAHANFIYLPPRGRPWREVLEPAGLTVRHYPDGAARVTVGQRASTRAVLAALAAVNKG